MNIKVTKDNVCIIERGNVHEGEYKINELSFEFSEEYTSDLVINAVFTNELGKAYQVSVIDGKCQIPAEILAETGQILLGVYAYKINGEELELRYSPFPTSFNVISGSYDSTAEESQEITPSQFEQYMQALNDGLNQVKDSISELNQATDNANDLVDEINQKLENGEFIGPQGIQGEPGKDGTNGIDGVGITTITSGQATEENGNTITPITVEKTDGSSETFNVSAKNGIDGKNGQNGKDGINGTNGIDGQDGITPNIQIGTVETLESTEQASVTRTGTDEEPLFNFGIPKGEKGEPGEVTEETLDNVVPKQTAIDSIINVNDALKYKVFNFNVDGAYEQTTSDGSNLLDIDYSEFPKEQGELHVELNNDYSFTVTGTKTTTDWNNVNFNFKNRIHFKQGVTYYLHNITVFLEDADGSNIRNQSSTFTAEQDMYCEGSCYWTTNTPGVKNETVRPYLGTVPYDESKYYKYTGGQPSPNPDYPQKITTLNFDKITKNGQNLYNVRDAYTEGFNSYNSAYQVDEDDWVTLNIENEPSDIGYYNLFTNNLNLKPETYYNIVLEVKQKSGVGTFSIVSQRIEGETQVEGQFNGSFSNAFGNLGPGIYVKKLKTLNKEQLDNTVAGLRSYIMLNKGAYSSMTFRISVLEDTSITPDTFTYQPYQETNYLIDLQDNEMVSLPNGVKDYLQIDKDGNVNLIKKVGKKILQGTDVVDIDETYFTMLAYSNISKPDDFIGKGSYDLNINYDNVVADKFYQAPDSVPRETYDKPYTIIPYMSSWSFGLTFPRGTTLEEAQEMADGTTVYYQLTEPQTINLGKLEDLISTDKGSNTFAINGNIDTQISMTYALDLKKYIDNKIATVSTAVIGE